jgi:hypothetical protein
MLGLKKNNAPQFISLDDWWVASLNAKYNSDHAPRNLRIQLIHQNKRTDWWDIKDKKVNNMMGEVFHQSLKTFLNEIQQWAQTNSKASTTVDAQLSQQLNWLKISLNNLEMAIKKAIEEPSLMPEFTLFLGTNPDDQRVFFRVVIFNLDFFFIFNQQGNIQLTFFDDKDFKQKNDQPSVDTLFNNYQFEVIDQITRLAQFCGKLWQDSIETQKKLGS